MFTTAYDLLIYWAMGSGGFKPFVDQFGGPNLEFNPHASDVLAGQIPVYFLHGALHLVVGGSGTTWKLRLGMETLLSQFGKPIDQDPYARPLLVTEGTSRDKLTAIESNEYLAHALERLRQTRNPVVVFGSRLSQQDDHLLTALNEHPSRAIAVAMRPGRKRDLAARQADIYGRLLASELRFFDAETRPLGQPSLTVNPS